MSYLVRVYTQSGDSERANELAEPIDRMIGNAESAEARASAFFALGEINYHKGGSSDSLRLFRSAVAEAENTDNARLRAECLLYLGFALIQVGDPEAARFVEESVNVSTNSNDTRSRAIGLVALGFVRSIFASKSDALVAYREAQALFPADLDLLQQARLANGIATAYEDYGDDVTSMSYRLRALELYGGAKYPAGELATLPNLALLYFLMGDKASAETSIKRSEELARTLGDSYSALVIEEYKGQFAYYEGDFPRSVNHFRTAASGMEKLEMKLPRLAHGLGRALAAAGKIDEAYGVFSRAIDDNLRARELVLASENLFELAKIQKSRGATSDAIETVRRSISYSEKPELHTGQSRLQSHFYSQIHDRYGLLIQLLMESRSQRAGVGNPLDSIVLSERSRARSTTESIALSDAAFEADADPSIVHQESAIRSKLTVRADTLVDKLAHNGSKEEIDLLDKEINALENQLEEIKSELKQKSPIYSAIKDPPPFDVADFQANILDDQTVVLEYFLGEDESYLWLIGKNEFEAFTLPGRETIEAKVDELRDLIDARRPVEGEAYEQTRKRINEAAAKYLERARDLSRVLLGPVAERIAGKRLVVVPDGKLHYFSISALPLPNASSDEPLLVTNEVVYQPSAQTFALLTKLRSNAEKRPSRDLLVFSDPVFSKNDSRLNGVEVTKAPSQNTGLNLRFAESLEGLKRLPASGDEAEAIAAIVGSRNTDRFSGFDATRDHLLNADLSNYRVIHLATHGLVNQERPELSAVILSSFDESGRPLNQAVRLQDIYAMKLNADLVVLSACQTAAGKEIKGEGVMGLNNAFLQAGARSVVASLWQVEDNATNLLMREFYKGLADGKTVSAALREAQLTLYRDPQYRSPFFWAAFTLQGDMNRRPEISSQISRWWLMSVPVIFLIGFIGWRRFMRGRLVTQR